MANELIWMEEKMASMARAELERMMAEMARKKEKMPVVEKIDDPRAPPHVPRPWDRGWLKPGKIAKIAMSKDFPITVIETADGSWALAALLEEQWDFEFGSDCYKWTAFVQIKGHTYGYYLLYHVLEPTDEQREDFAKQHRREALWAISRSAQKDGRLER